MKQLDHALSNSIKKESVSVEELLADSCPADIYFLKRNIWPRSEASRGNLLVLRTSNFQGATIRPIVPSHEYSIVFM